MTATARRRPFRWAAKMIARILLLVAILLAPLVAKAEERIVDFDVSIEVEKDGDIAVTEKIAVIAQGYQIRRGIFRDLPRTYLKGARTLPYVYDVKRVTRDGKKEPYAIEKDGNAFRIRIGDADVFLNSGPHTYEITYEVKNQVRYFDGYDEVYWNVTGNYWVFPIDHAIARVALPNGAGAVQTAGYTGYLGDADRFYAYRVENGVHLFEATRPFAPGQGLTVSVGFEKGVVDPPSAADARAEWWAANASFIILSGAALLIGLYYVFTWMRIGRDPAKGPVFPHYEPPNGLSPAATHYVYHRGLRGHNAFISTIINLAIRKRVAIEPGRKQKTTLTRLQGGNTEGLENFEHSLEQRLLIGEGAAFTFGGKYSSTLTSAYEAFRKSLGKAYGPPYFRWNIPYLLVAIGLSIGALIMAVNVALAWTSLHTLIVLALVFMALAAAYFLPAPTEKGQETRTAIEGFRLYLKTAEQLQLNAVKVGSDAPPPMTVERYERFLPYAIALGVEKPWTKHFEHLMPKEAADYAPYWSSGHYGGSRSLSGINSALVSSMASGVSSSLPQSSSSSGSGGGGSSGGGGGGGGGGGW